MNFRPLKVIATVVLLSVIAGGCYLPVRFDAEIELDPHGYYSMIFDGYMADVVLYDGIKTKKMSPTDQKSRIEGLEKDINRDSNVKEYKYIKEGFFKVHWERKGDLLKSKTVTFLRRNARIISLKYIRTTGQIVMEGIAIGKTKAEQLIENGLNIQGELRLITDAQVTVHNATDVKKRDGGKTMYTWKINSLLNQVPRLAIKL
ncbi:MAG: hypothetical protein OEY85_05280 [Rhodospirillales bacterium]|nr:hypothetical protein [Rhodospirillales bacterium]